MGMAAWLLVATTILAVVAVGAAIVAVHAVRELKRASAAPIPVGDCRPMLFEPAEVDASSTLQPLLPEPAMPELAPRVVQGRVIVPPTQAQVVRTALGRPGVRLSILAHGLARALRSENRDRIVALMRREYRHRRRERLSAGRQAIRMARPTSAPTTDRLHEHLLEPQPLSLTDRMIRS